MDLTVPALLFPAIAILMLGYVNRFVSCAAVIRTFKKDYDSGYVHVDVQKQLSILRDRIKLFQAMVFAAATALLLACLSMGFIYKDLQEAGKLVFGLSLVAMVISIILSLYETTLSNKSLIIEIDDILTKENSRHKKD